MYRVRTVFDGMQGAPWLNTLYFDQGGGTAQQAVTAVGNFWGAVDALIDSEVNWRTEADVTDINPLTGQPTSVIQTTPVTGTGAAVGDALPVATQALVRWRTGFFSNGRERRGRTFVPALVEASGDNGKLLAASQTTIQTAAAALIADVNSILVVWSRPDLPTLNGGFSAVTASSVWEQFAVLRSRRD